MTSTIGRTPPITMDQTSAKADVLASIKRNLSAGIRLNGSHSDVSSTMDRPRAASVDASVLDQRSLVETFCENLSLVGGRVTVVQRSNDVVTALKTILDELNPGRIAVSDSPIVRAAVAAAAKAEIREDAAARELFDCDVGITEAQWAIAETGTLVLESNKETNRLASLVPAAHICILPAANICSTMSEILERLDVDVSPAVTFITGPSRTSDIELTLAIGVHGPRDLFVIVAGD